MAAREPQIISQDDRADDQPRNAAGGKFAAKSNARDENLVFLESDKLEVEIKGGRWVLAHQPAKPPKPPKPVQHYFPDD